MAETECNRHELHIQGRNLMPDAVLPIYLRSQHAQRRDGQRFKTWSNR